MLICALRGKATSCCCSVLSIMLVVLCWAERHSQHPLFGAWLPPEVCSSLLVFFAFYTCDTWHPAPWHRCHVGSTGPSQIPSMVASKKKLTNLQLEQATSKETRVLWAPSTSLHFFRAHHSAERRVVLDGIDSCHGSPLPLPRLQKTPSSSDRLDQLGIENISLSKCQLSDLVCKARLQNR